MSTPSDFNTSFDKSSQLVASLDCGFAPSLWLFKKKDLKIETICKLFILSITHLLANSSPKTTNEKSELFFQRKLFYFQEKKLRKECYHSAKVPPLSYCISNFWFNVFLPEFRGFLRCFLGRKNLRIFGIHFWEHFLSLQQLLILLSNFQFRCKILILESMLNPPANRSFFFNSRFLFVTEIC